MDPRRRPFLMQLRIHTGPWRIGKAVACALLGSVPASPVFAQGSAATALSSPGTPGTPGAPGKPGSVASPKPQMRPTPAVRRNNNLNFNRPGGGGGTSERGGNVNSSLNITSSHRVAPDAPPSRFPLPLAVESIQLAPSPANLRARIQALDTKPDFAEPVMLRFNTLEPGPILEQLARQSVAEKLLTREAARLKADFRASILSRIKDMRLSLEPRDLVWIDLQKLSATVAQTSVMPFLSLSLWRQALDDPHQSSDLRDHFGDRMGTVVREVERQANGEQPETPGVPALPRTTGVLAAPGTATSAAPEATASRARGQTIALDAFLPAHVRDLLGRYSPLRGRNCFATALSFSDARVELMRNINLVREEGHHAAMINNDEFAQALWLGYRELDGTEILEGLMFGDVVAFLDLSDGESYVALKHALVHVAGDVYLHKPSKSASSPIEFTRWNDVARTWATLARDLDYKVYRRLPIGSLRQSKSQNAIENIHWSK